ncbi:MAG TPA: helix-turn-helix transcriptional regulator, partial [Thermoanaerobaculia bacterium]|nr:helix-turn-helix transcriptional regulator [Thermoanaerobaculia bacterium]
MPEPNALLLASALKLLRTLLEWDQGALARAAGVDRSTVRRWEAGDVALDRERLEALATRMGATPAQVAAAVAFAEARAARELEEGGTCGPTAADPRRELAEQAVCAADGELRRFLEATRRAADRAAEREEAAARWRELRELPQE